MRPEPIPIFSTFTLSEKEIKKVEPVVKEEKKSFQKTKEELFAEVKSDENKSRMSWQYEEHREHKANKTF